MADQWLPMLLWDLFTRQVTRQAVEHSMHRISRVVSAAALIGSLWGCSAEPAPMVVLMPTYSYERDGIDFDGPEPRRLDAVAAVEP